MRFYHPHFTDGNTESQSEDLLGHSSFRNRFYLSLGPLEQKAGMGKLEVRGWMEE